MPRKNDRRSSNRIEPSWGADARAESYGPQGNALILELQRLRQAFDNEGQDPRSGSRRNARDGGGRNRRPPSRKSRRKKKGTMERAIDMCLRPFGLRTALPHESLQDIDVLREPPPPLPRPRRRSPELASEPLAPDIARPRQYLPAPSNLPAQAGINQARPKLPVRLEA